MTKPKNPKSRRYRLEKARELSGQVIRYVTEKKNDVEEVVGKDGGLNFRDGELIVFSSAKVVFRCRYEDMQAWDLLSGDGVVITAPDLESGGQERTVTVHYVYHRK